MARNFLLTLLLLLVVAPAWALPGRYTPFTKTPRDATSMHMAVVYDDFAVVNDGPANENDAQFNAFYENLEGVIASFEARGVEVHRYTYSEMQADPRLWRWLGGTRLTDGFAAAGADSGGYGVVLAPYWLLTEGSGATARNATGPMSLRRFAWADSTNAHVVHFGGMTHDWDDNSAAGTDSNFVGSIALLTTELAFLGSTQGPHLMTRQGDTLFVNRVVYARSLVTGWSSTLPVQVVKMFATRPTRDTVWTASATRDTFALAWKVKSTLTGRWVDFITAGQPPHSSWAAGSSAPVLQATLTRYLAVQPIDLGMESADWFQWGADPHYVNTRSATNPSNWAWPRAALAESMLTAMRTQYGVDKIALGTVGDSLAYYREHYPDWQQFIDRTRGGANVRWFHHDHVEPSDSLLVTGPTYGIGQQYADTTTSGSAVYSFRRSPALVRRSLARSDSIFKALGLVTSYFQLPGADRMVPMGAFDYSNAALCPAESLFASLAASDIAVVANRASAQTNATTISSSVQSNRAQSVVAGYRWPVYPGEVYRTAGGKEIVFTEYVAATGDSAGNPISLANKYAAFGDIYALLGLHTSAAIPNSPPLLYGSTNTATDRHFGRGRASVYGWHSQYMGDRPNSWIPEWQQVGPRLQTLKALGDVAGRPLVRWVWPEDAGVAK